MENKNISIIVDSGSDLLPDEAAQLGVILLPLNVRFNDEQFLDGITISRDEFYKRMETLKQLPKTSLISPAIYEEVFETELRKGNEVLCLTLSSGVSGSYQSAVIAAGSFDKGVYVVDTKQFCGPEYVLVRRAIQLKNRGYRASEIAEIIEEERDVVVVRAMFDTLEYLKLGGRLSSASAMVGELLAIKPIMTITDGKPVVLTKARGTKNANAKIIQIINDDGGIDFSKPVVLSWSGVSSERLEAFKQKAAFLFVGHEDEIAYERVGATIGTYSGPNAFAISYYPKKK